MPNSKKSLPNRFKILPTIKKRFLILPKWRNFAQARHTGSNTSYTSQRGILHSSFNTQHLKLFVNMGQTRTLFFIFVRFQCNDKYSTKFESMEKHRRCAGDSTPGPHNGRCKRIHRAVAASLEYKDILGCNPRRRFTSSRPSKL